MIKVSAAIDKALRKLDRVEKSQVPFALSVAINETVNQAVSEDIPQEAEQSFDRPTRWTKRAFRFERSTKRKLYAVVKRKTAQQGRHYLSVQSKGGTRPKTGTEKFVIGRVRGNRGIKTVAPASGARLNAAGNWSPAQRKRALNSALARGATTGKFFIPGERSHLSPGVYERVGRRRKIRKVAHFSSSAARYTARLSIRKPVARRVQASFPGNFRSALRKALATAE